MPADSFAVLQLTYGPFFWMQAVYSYTVFVLATLLVLQTYLQARVRSALKAAWCWWARWRRCWATHCTWPAPARWLTTT